MRHGVMALGQKKTTSKLFFFKKNLIDIYIFFQNTRNIFKNKSMEIKKNFLIKKLGPFFYF